MNEKRFEKGQLVKAHVGDSYFDELNSVTISHIALEDRYGFKVNPMRSKSFIDRCVKFQTGFSRIRNGAGLLKLTFGEIPIYHLNETYGKETFERIKSYCDSNLEGVEYYIEKRFKGFFSRHYLDNVLHDLINKYKEDLTLSWFILGVPTIKVNNDDDVLNKTNEIRIDFNHFLSREYIDQTNPNLPSPFHLSYYFPKLSINENEHLLNPLRKVTFTSDLAHGDMGIVVGEYDFSYRPVEMNLRRELEDNSRAVELDESDAMFLFERYLPGKYYRIMHKCRNSSKHSETLVHEKNLVPCSSDNQIDGEEWKNHVYLPALPFIDHYTRTKGNLVHNPVYNFNGTPLNHKDLILSGITKYWYRDMYQLLGSRSRSCF